MRLVKLDIQAMPGIDPGFSISNVDPGINMVTGPNAIGKSSLLRALRYLIIEPGRHDPPLSLSAVFEDDSRRWTVRRTGSDVTWELDGRITTRPAFPGSDQLYCYWLSMEELLQAEKDESIVSDLRRTVSGGIDLRAMHQESPIRLSSTIGRSESKKLREVEDARRRIEGEYEDLRRQEDDIPGRVAEIDAARRALARQEKISMALDLLDARLKRKGIDAGLDEFPEGMDLLRGDELENLDEIERERKKQNIDLDTNENAEKGAQETLKETRLEGGWPEKEDLDTRFRLLEDARVKQGKREQEQEALEKAQAAEGMALDSLGGIGKKPELGPNSIDRAEGLAREIQKTEIQCDHLQAKITSAGELTSVKDSSTQYQRAADALREWLASGTGKNRIPKVPLVIGILGAMIMIIAAAVTLSWAALVGGVIAVAGFAWAIFDMRGGESLDDPQKRFHQTGQTPPATWNTDTVRARLDEIEESMAKARLQEIQGRQMNELQNELDTAEEKLKGLQEQKAEMAADLGFDPMLTAVSLDRFVRLVSDYEEAQRNGRSARSTIDRLEGGIAGYKTDVHDFLVKWDSLPDGEENLEMLRAGLHGLQRRSGTAQEAHREIDAALREQKRISGEIVKLDEKEAALMGGVNLEVGQELELSRRIEHLEAWKSQQERLRAATVLEAEKRKNLEGEEDLLALVEEEAREKLFDEESQAEQTAGKLEDLLEAQTAIKTRLDDAGRNHNLESASSEVDIARTALEQKYEEVLLGAAARVMLDDVQQEFKTEHEPDVLREARERFRRFTQNTYDIDLDEEEGLRAYDLGQEVYRNLEELSTATRMQLLLAVRMAWISHMEAGRESLPVFLDEALTTSDEQRFAQVAANLEQLSREESRQIFYLCASRYEAGLWEHTTGHKPHLIDLADVRFGITDAHPEDYILPEPELLPSPDGMDSASYAAALGVPSVDPCRPAGSLHIFHILRDDLPLLYNLLENWHMLGLGQLESLLAGSAAAEAVSDSVMRKRLVGRVDTAQAWVEVWLHGRGMPVDRNALEMSGAVSAAFIDRVSDLNASLDGDGAMLIGALRAGKIKRFQTDNIASLEDYLLAEGFINEDAPYSREERARQTLLSVAGKAEPGDINKIVSWLENGMEK
ncbi:MAG: hypothetical protein ACYC0L_08195 [Thermoleophilia bacterium]